MKVVLDEQGSVTTRMEYLPYGETWFQEGDESNKPKYNSQELDEETNFYFYNARHYDPEIARFVTADNIIPDESSSQSWNRFSYVRNNPIVYKDPTGHAEEDAVGETSEFDGDVVATIADSLTGGNFSNQYKNKGTNNNKQAKELSKANDKTVKSSTSKGKMPDFGSPLSTITKSSQLKSKGEGGSMTSSYGSRIHPITKLPESSHPGVDFSAEEGTAITAAADGRISYHTQYKKDNDGKYVLDKSGNKIITGYGHYAMVHHKNGYQTRYAHMNKKDWEQGKKDHKQWSKVKKGDKIGGVGNSGASTGPHLHFEIRKRKGKEPLNPKVILENNLK